MSHPIDTAANPASVQGHNTTTSESKLKFPSLAEATEQYKKALNANKTVIGVAAAAAGAIAVIQSAVLMGFSFSGIENLETSLLRASSSIALSGLFSIAGAAVLFGMIISVIAGTDDALKGRAQRTPQEILSAHGLHALGLSVIYGSAVSVGIIMLIIPGIAVSWLGSMILGERLVNNSSFADSIEKGIQKVWKYKVETAIAIAVALAIGFSSSIFQVIGMFIPVVGPAIAAVISALVAGAMSVAYLMFFNVLNEQK